LRHGSGLRLLEGMKGNLLLATLAAATTLVACGGGTLTQAGSRVKVMKGDPPANCTEVGSVSSYTVGPDYQERNKNKLRNEAADKQANYLRLEQNDGDGNAAGTAFRCP
jgi:Domain of unknown function (DUF4156)